MPWRPILAPETEEAGARVPFRVLFRRGHPFLLLPVESGLARQTLSLYPPQTARARVAKVVFALCLRVGLCPRAVEVELRVAERSPFAEFLRATTGSEHLPRFGALAGNPGEEGQRVVFLVFDRKGRPRRVIKAGQGGRAAALIESELAVLRALPTDAVGVPRVRGDLGQNGLRAFAMDFVGGRSPKLDGFAAPHGLLRSWIQTDREAPLGQLPAWRRLREACAGEEWFGRLDSSLTRAVVHPVIHHGQFSPWNIKVSPRDGTWTVLDLERGDLDGVPAWDWFHFVIQPEVLVRRRAPADIAARVDRLLASTPFRDYARAANVAGLERVLLAAYLAYIARVIRPTGGAAATAELLRQLMAENIN